MTTADYLTSLQNDLATIKTNLSDGGMSIDEGDNFTNIATKTVGIVIGGGGQEVKEKDVNFYFHDGSILASYTTNEFLNLTAMPTAPEIEGLTFVKWNWNFNDAKNYVTKFGELDVGGIYKTNDNSFRLYINLLEDRMSPYVGFAIVGTATIDWGDNSQTTTVTGSSITSVISTQHNYAQAGKYVIKISSNTTIYILGTNYQGSKIIWNNDASNNYGNRYYQSLLYKIECGNNVSFGNYSFKYLSYLQYIVSPILPSGSGMFVNCTYLKHLNIPDDLASIGSNLYSSLYNLKTICLPNSITTINSYAFAYNYSMEKLIIPDSVTTISSGIISNNVSIKKIIIGSGVTSLASDLFNSIYSLQKIKGYNNVTTLNSFVSSCTLLKEIDIPDNVTTINSQALASFPCITHFTLSSKLTSIGNYAFMDNYGMKYYDFSNCEQVPTLGNNVFTNIPTDCKIIVPDNLYDTWKTTGNWANYSTYIISKTDWDNL